MENSSERWFTVIVRDSHSLSGKSVEKFVGPLLSMLGIKCVFVRDLAGSLGRMADSSGTLIGAADFMSRVGTAGQYDWAFFFLFGEQPSCDPTSLDARDDTALVGVADLTIRLVDDSFFYVYGRDSNVFRYLCERYPEREGGFSDFESVVIPY